MHLLARPISVTTGGGSRFIYRCAGQWAVGLLISLSLSACLLLAACDDPPPPRTVKGDLDGGIKPGKPVTAFAILSLKKATAAAVRLRDSIVAGRPARDEYLQLRRNVATSQPLFRLSGKQGAALLIGAPLAGPLRPTDVAGGALGRLDRALGARDNAAATKQLAEVTRALRLIDNELSLRDVPPEPALQAISDAVFELGMMLLEANAAVAEHPDAVLADIAGMLDGIEGGAQAAVELASADRRKRASDALRVVRMQAAGLRAAFGKLTHAHQLRDRAQLVRITGHLGVACRRLARELGVRTRLPYSARRPVAANRINEPITPLTVPAPRPAAGISDGPAMAELGRKLFFDQRLARGAPRSCASCHMPDKAFSDGLATAMSIDPKRPITRNTPSLLYATLHAIQLWDGRLPGAELQTPEMIHDEAAMGMASSQLQVAVAGAEEYRAPFMELFDDGVTAKNIARALRAYLAHELVPATAPLDRFARGEADALNGEQRVGFDIFVGIGRCARCHLPPLFGGSRPPDFSVATFAALGVPAEPGSKQLDADRGRAMVTKQDEDAHRFRTPTVRNVSLTAPYFHHGRFSTLEQVVDFYDKGGGVGAGVAIDNQDRNLRKLNLSVEHKAQLIAFLRDALQDAKLPSR